MLPCAALNIGARRFRCITIPIVRNGYGVVGAIASTSTSWRWPASGSQQQSVTLLARRGRLG
jgi:hypothetical protein